MSRPPSSLPRRERNRGRQSRSMCPWHCYRRALNCVLRRLHAQEERAEKASARLEQLARARDDYEAKYDVCSIRSARFLSDQGLVGYSQENQGPRSGAGRVVAEFRVDNQSDTIYINTYITQPLISNHHSHPWIELKRSSHLLFVANIYSWLL